MGCMPFAYTTLACNCTPPWALRPSFFPLPTRGCGAAGAAGGPAGAGHWHRGLTPLPGPRTPVYFYTSEAAALHLLPLDHRSVLPLRVTCRSPTPPLPTTACPSMGPCPSCLQPQPHAPHHHPAVHTHVLAPHHTPALPGPQSHISKTNKYLPENSQINVSLHNDPRTFIVMGPPRSLYGLVTNLRKIHAPNGSDQSKIGFSKRKPVFNARFLVVGVPFHS
jgi:hypothetical protein